MIAGGNEKGVGGVTVMGAQCSWGAVKGWGGGEAIGVGGAQCWRGSTRAGDGIIYRVGGAPAPPALLQWAVPSGGALGGTDGCPPPPIPPQGVCGAQCPQCKRSWLGGGGAMTPWGGGTPVGGGWGASRGGGGSFPCEPSLIA